MKNLEIENYKYVKVFKKVKENKEMDGIGRRIKFIREDLGIKAVDLAKKADLSPEHLSRIERGINNNVRVNTLSSIAKGLGVELSYLIFGATLVPAEQIIESENLTLSWTKLGDLRKMNPDKVIIIINRRSNEED